MDHGVMDRRAQVDNVRWQWHCDEQKTIFIYFKFTSTVDRNDQL